MNLRQFRPGTGLCLPVFHSGALLSLGDVHAAMGAGEPCLVAIEASAEVTVRIDLEKGRRLEYPRLSLPEGTAFLGMGQSLWAAQKAACEQAFEHLTGECGLLLTVKNRVFGRGRRRPVIERPPDQPRPARCPSQAEIKGLPSKRADDSPQAVL